MDLLIGIFPNISIMVPPLRFLPTGRISLIVLAAVVFITTAMGQHTSAISKFGTLKPLVDKTLVAWCSPYNLEQHGSGIMSIEQASGFDAIVLGEIRPGVWMAGSNNFARTQTDQLQSKVETAPELVQIAIVYHGNTITIYRNGGVYAEYPVKSLMDFGGQSQILIGLRHKAMMAGCFAGSVEEARLYDVALDAAAIKLLRLNDPGKPAPLAMWTFENGSTSDIMGVFPAGELHGGASVKEGRLFLDGDGDYMATPTEPRYEKTLHFRPDTGSAGDTIPFFWKGAHHIFYLHAGNWAHIVSTDLVHWKELPDALTKGTDPLGPDGEACWTGSIVEDKGVFHLFYTGKNSRDPKGDQKVMHATSNDLITWVARPGDTFYADGKTYWSKPVNGPIDDSLIYHHQAFRDPAVLWNAKENEWWMVMHAALADGSSPAMALHVSKDLTHWEPRDPLVVYPKGISGDCPDVFQSNGKWYIHCADNRYFVADDVAGPYELSPFPYDTGDLRVPKVMFDGKRNILIGWMGDREGSSDAGKMMWGGTLSMPREFYADDTGRLLQRPAQELIHHFSQQVLDVPEGRQFPARWDVPRDFMLHAKLRATTPDARVTIAFRQPTDGSGYHLNIDFQSREVELGDKFRSNKRGCDFDPADPLDVRLFVVGTVVECFINDSYCFTMRVYDSWGAGLSISASAGDFENLGLTVSEQKPWSLK